jgi:hypothetical protein
MVNKKTDKKKTEEKRQWNRGIREVGKRNARKAFAETGAKKAFSGDFGVAYEQDDKSWLPQVKEETEYFLSRGYEYTNPTTAVGYAHLVLKEAAKRGSVEGAKEAIRLYEKFNPKKLTRPGTLKLLDSAAEKRGINTSHDDIYSPEELWGEDFDPEEVWHSNPQAYIYDEARVIIERAKRNQPESGGLEKGVTATVAIVSLIGSLFFLSPNITGNTIAALTNSTSNMVGAGLLVIGLISGSFWMKNRK